MVTKKTDEAVAAVRHDKKKTSVFSGAQRRRPRGRGPEWREAVAGAGAGAVAKTVLAPIERLKLLLQLRGSSSQTIASGGAWQVAAQVYREQGVWSFWRGNWASVLRTAGTSAINFTCMDYYKKVAVGPVVQGMFLRHDVASAHGGGGGSERRRKLITSLVSSGLAGATSTTLLYPLEFGRTRLAMDMGNNQDNRQFVNLRSVLSYIWATDGVRGFWQGYGIALTGGVVFRIMYLGGYDSLKDQLVFLKQQRQGNTTSEKAINEADLTWGERVASAQFISLTAGTLAYPFDSVRRRMMMQAGVPRAERQYRHSWHCIVSVYKLEGWSGFYRGLAPNLVRSVSGALLLVAYDGFRHSLG